MQRCQHLLLNAVPAGGKQALGRQGFQTFNHHAAAHLDGRHRAHFAPAVAGIQPQRRQRRREFFRQRAAG